MDSLKPYLIEEAYELIDAIDKREPSDHCEELGDVLLQIVFQSQIASENDWFDAHAVVDTLCRKLIRRHPHVFGTEKADTPAEVIKHWERIKAEEKDAKNDSSITKKTEPSVLDGVPASFPPLLSAQILSKRASKVGFDWQSHHGVMKKVQEELEELQEAIELNTTDAPHHREVFWELGDVIFALVNLARHLDIDASESLRHANQRFGSRFRLIETMAAQRKIDISKADLDKLEHLWQEAKTILKQEKKKP